MKRKLIVLDDEDSGQDKHNKFLEKDCSRPPRRRLASLCLSDSSRTLSPEPRSTKSKDLRARKPIKSSEIIDLGEEVYEIRPISLDEGGIIDVEELELELASDIFEIREAPDVACISSWTRNPPVKPPLKKVDTVKSRRGERLVPGCTVELRDGRFLEIVTILENTETKVVTLSGWELKRTKSFGGEIKLRHNEVCYIFDVDLDDSRPMREQSVIEIELRRAKKIRHLVRTNYHFPAYRFDVDNLPDGTKEELKAYIEANEVLVARWQYITTFRTAKDRDQQAKYSANYQSRKILRLDEKECDKDYYLPLYALRYQWRGDVVLGDQAQPGTKSKPPTNVICIDDEETTSQGTKEWNSIATQVSIDVASIDFVNVDPWSFMYNIRRRFDAKVRTEANAMISTGRASESLPLKVSSMKSSTDRGNIEHGTRTKTNRPLGRGTGPKSAETQYSYADAFCGAGGATRGAVMAGLRVVWGLDFNANAAQTWRHNFPQGEMFEKWADEVCSMPDPEGKLIVDVLHLSPPCQVWSPAHTVAGKDDDMNFASLYAVQELIAKAKPRIVTLEQTFGIVHERFRGPFNSLIRMFTDHNFSVSWQILDLERLGLPQKRKRLIIVAAAPGETLPPVPQYTHSRDGRNGMKPFRSARRALSSIPSNAANHDVPTHPLGSYMPWDDSTIIPNCITTGGANGRGHPTGCRGLTCREVASLQTFPHGHVFKGQGIRKQIGNAVPPLIARLVFSEVKKHLEQVDAEEKRTLEE